jgi:TolA-binding protein
LLSLQRVHDTALGHKREAAWSKDTGVAKYEAWLKDYPEHLLTPNAKYRLARALIAAGRFEDGRVHLRAVAANELRCTLTDDAQQWIARSFALEGKTDEAAVAFGVLLRDYSWSAHAAAAQGNYKPAGPVKE